MNFKEITTYEAICAAIKEDHNVLPGVVGMSEKEANDTIKSFKYKRMVRAMNVQEDGTIWEPNWHNRSEPKIRPWFEIEASAEQPGGSGFSYSCYTDWYSHSVVGSRLLFQSPERFWHALEHFKEMFLDEYLIR